MRSDRSRILPILIAVAGLFTAAGCTAPARMPEAPPFTVAPTDSDEAVAAGKAAADHADGHRAPPPGEAAGPVASIAGADQPPFEQLIAIDDDSPLPQTGRTGADALSVRSSEPLRDWAVGLPGRSSADVIRRHLATLQFARGSASLAREEYIILHAVAALRARQGGGIAVIGHADRGGATGLAARRVNRMIAERRAAAVADALVALGLPRTAITSAGRGDEEPLYAETNAGGAAGNRRAEIYLLPADTPTVAAQAGPGEGAEDAAAPTEGEAVSSAVSFQQASAQPSTRPEDVVEPAAAVVPEEGPSVEPTAEGGGEARRIPVATLYFAHASSRLGTRERAIIEAAAVFQQRYQGTIVIVGHASAAGSGREDPERLERANRAVAFARADAVAKRLAACGIPADSLSVVGKGADEPAFVEGDAAGEAGNRRVEIYVDLPAAVRLADRGLSLPR